MTDIKPLLERNQTFASSYSNTLSITPRFSTIILTCLDARTDPAHFLGLEAGDALVIRNSSLIPKDLNVTGYLMDIENGLVNEVNPLIRE